MDASVEEDGLMKSTDSSRPTSMSYPLGADSALTTSGGVIHRQLRLSQLPCSFTVVYRKRC